MKNTNKNENNMTTRPFDKLKVRNTISIVAAIIAFAVITLVYFNPVLQGKRIKQHDIEMHLGMSQEINQYREATGEQTLWTNAPFGGMPAWNISVAQNQSLPTFCFVLSPTPLTLRGAVPHHLSLEKS